MAKHQEDLILLIVINAEVSVRCVMEFFEKGSSTFSLTARLKACKALKLFIG